jgi:hypothetical protein
VEFCNKETHNLPYFVFLATKPINQLSPAEEEDIIGKCFRKEALEAHIFALPEKGDVNENWYKGARIVRSKVECYESVEKN